MPVQDQHRRYFRVAGITVCVESELDFSEIRFKPEFASFAVDGPGDDNVTLRHYFGPPDLTGEDLGTEVYRTPPWAIFRRPDSWIYRSMMPTGTGPEAGCPDLHHVAVFNASYTSATIWTASTAEEVVRRLGWHSLSLFPTDQIWLAPLLADRHALLLHSAAVILNGRGLVFVGHSGAGKSTVASMLQHAAISTDGHPRVTVEVLCDDRNVVRRWRGGWRVHGTWSHGDVPDVSSASAPLAAILFLQQDARSDIVPVTDHKDSWKRLLATLVKPMATAEWWEKELDLLEDVIGNVPCYTMHFDRSGAIVDTLMRL